jgi:Tol biopolymer transport system component
VALAAGTRLGPYEILAPLGAGGMGEVYRARDARLGREVAVKVIPEAVAGDAERMRRFESEARTAGALAHPNLLAVHDVGTHEGRPYIVFELLEGRTLREVLGGEGLPPRKAVETAVQVAQGLAAAHDKGIVHRDLKPENLFVTRDGRVKVLDFGLAKAAGVASGAAATVPGSPAVLVGTVGYVSPEQVRGLPADARSDIFALGAVLFEMLAGRRAFARDTAVETLHAILNEDPGPLDAACGVPPPVERIARRCLEKRPEERFQSARDVAFALQAVPLDSGPAPARAAGRWGSARRAALAAAAAIAAVTATVAALRAGRAAPPLPDPPVVRYVTHSGKDEDPALSPDGQMVAFVSNRDGRNRIWRAHLRSGEEAPLTDGPLDDHPRFSRDGSAILFVRVDARGDGALFRVPVVGGEPRRVMDDARDGADWSPAGDRLAFVRRGGAQMVELWVAAADGSGARRLARLPALWVTPPRWSPDGRRIAFAHGRGAAPTWTTLVVDADSGRQVALAPPLRFGILSVPAWCCQGRALLYMESESGQERLRGRLVRQEVPSGRAQTILREQAMGSGLDVAGPDAVVFDAYPTRGTLREQPLAGAGPGRWLTRAFADDRQPVFSPDGQRIVFSSNRGGNLDLWELGLATGTVHRLTDHPADDIDPHFMRDGRLVWSSRRGGSFEIWVAESDGSSPRQVSRDGFDAENPTATPDGRWIVYSSANPQRQGLWQLRADGQAARRLVAGITGLPEISPDGAWLLFSDYDRALTTLRVIRLADGAPAGFEIRLNAIVGVPRTRYIRGRARWTADGRAIAFVDEDRGGLTGVFVQDFLPGHDTTASRRRLAGFDPERVTESFGLSPDGRRIAIALREVAAHVLLASGVPGLRE